MVQAAIGGPTLLALSLTLAPVSSDALDAFFTPAAIGSLFFLSLLGTIVAYTIYLVLLRKWGIVRTGLYAFVSPIVALGAGAWWFGEKNGWTKIAGASLMLAAAGLALLRISIPLDVPTRQRDCVRSYETAWETITLRIA